MPPILLATPTLGQVRIEHEIAYSQCVLPMGKLLVRMAWIGMPIEDARNAAVLEAEEHGYEYLMFYDDDIVPENNDAIRLLHATMLQNPHIDILGGVYPRRGTYPEPIVFSGENEGVTWCWKDGGVHQVYATGTGLTMFRVESLQKVKCESYRMGNGRSAKKYFELGPDVTDEFTFAKKSTPADLTWYVHGSVIADQINLDGRRFSVRDAVIDAPLPKKVEKRASLKPDQAV